MRTGTTLGTNLVDFLPLHLLDLVLPDALPHDVGDRGCDQTEMDVNLHSTKRKECASKSSENVKCFRVLSGCSLRCV